MPENTKPPSTQPLKVAVSSPTHVPAANTGSVSKASGPASSEKAAVALAVPAATAALAPAQIGPVTRVQQQERCDDALACIAMLSAKSLAEVVELAFSVGYPRVGPAFVSDDMLVILAMKSGGWVGKNYKPFESFAKLPPIAILYVDYSEVMDVGRTVLWLRPPKEDGASSLKSAASNKTLSIASPGNKMPASEGVGATMDLGAGYVIDPAYWITPEQQVLTGVAAVHFQAEWYMEMNLSATKTGKS